MAAVEVLKSPADRKSYRYVKLENGMSVLLVHDPEIALTAATGDEVRSRGRASASGALWARRDLLLWILAAARSEAAHSWGCDAPGGCGRLAVGSGPRTHLPPPLQAGR